MITGILSCETDIATVNKLTGQYEASSETGKDIEVIYSNLGIVKAKLSRTGDVALPHQGTVY
jgi:hypothetical protein